ncbi:hypothetical protein BgAZ_104770 [Babesia gibsoni]|uniref:Uncharacterized protein n=1 Tax=Babesia gibsoni TaxID=33632 RepID=A0AAD8PFY7_BABGI|nr:hypothetical protein BgAZ_104770 [Babesia gibsoni]
MEDTKKELGSLDPMEKAVLRVDQLESCSSDADETREVTDMIPEDIFRESTLRIPKSTVDDVNPSIPIRNPLQGNAKPTAPSGMLMGPDDPFFQETRTSVGIPRRGDVKYDIIGPFGMEPDPDIDVPGVPNPFPRRGPNIPPSNSSMFPGGGKFGGGSFGGGSGFGGGFF